VTHRFEVFDQRVTLTPADLLYATDFAPGTLERDFAPESGSWRHVEHGLEGSIDREHAAACWHRERFGGDVALRFEASTVAPHTRDINCYWSGAGSIYGEPPNDCYVAGIAGWWANKHGIERYPDGGWRALTGGAPLEPERRYTVIAGRVGAWQFLFLDGTPVVEAFDPDPLRGDRIHEYGTGSSSSKLVCQVGAPWIESADIEPQSAIARSASSARKHPVPYPGDHASIFRVATQHALCKHGRLQFRRGRISTPVSTWRADIKA